MGSVASTLSTGVCDPNGSLFAKFPDDLTTEQVLSRWNKDIRRAADRAAWSFGTRSAEACDFAQEARISLLRAHSRHPGMSEAFARTVIANSMVNTARSEKTLLEHTAVVGAEAELAELADRPQDSTFSSDHTQAVQTAVRKLISTLPSRLRKVYTLLYEEGFTQREAAKRLGISQPRIAELNTQLLVAVAPLAS